MVKYERVVALLKCLMASYLITGLLLVFIAFLLYKMQLGEEVVDIAILIVYVVSSLVSGLLYAKGAKSRRFIWGTVAGLTYFAVICLVSVAIEPQEFDILSNSCITTLFICAGSGMLGGMIG